MSTLELRAVQRVIDQARAAGVEIPPEILSLSARLEHGTGTAYALWREQHPDDELPDGALGCCWGAAVYGPERCTCWEPVFDVDQADPQLPVAEGSIMVRRSRCGDCAFRRDSPERADRLTEDELLDLARSATPFWCHDGMRRPVAYRHPVLGDVPGSTADWQPPTVSGVPFRRDGSPGLLCAGWAQEVRRVERQEGVAS
jgi:hypothetical protein